MILLEDSADFLLWHDPSFKCLYAMWQGCQTKALMRLQYALIQKHQRLTRSTKLLNDTLLNKNSWEAVACWLADDCFERLAAEGLWALAWVVPRHIDDPLNTACVLPHLKQPLVDTFTDVESAYNWLHRWPELKPAVSATGFSLYTVAPRRRFAAPLGPQ